MYTTCVIWLAFVPLYFGTANHVPLRITSMSVTISLSASVTLACLFSPKVNLWFSYCVSSITFEYNCVSTAPHLNRSIILLINRLIVCSADTSHRYVCSSSFRSPNSVKLHKLNRDLCFTVFLGFLSQLI